MLFDCTTDTMIAAAEGTAEEQARYIMEAFSYADPTDRCVIIAAAHGAAELTRSRRGRSGVIEFSPVKKPAFSTKMEGPSNMDRKVVEELIGKGKDIAEELETWAHAMEEKAGAETPDSRYLGGRAVVLKGIFDDIINEIDVEA